ncbi:MAG: hypothetical protein M0Q90_16980 [Bacteroidales bacterium]|nr:hypothetical protein [Bacteroidales bacterium]
MSQELENTDKQEVAIIDESQIKQFQSLYYLFKGKRDTEIKLFDSYKQFSYDDIIELNEKVYKKLELHEKLTDLTHVTVGLDNNEIRTFGNWYEFTQTDWQISARTKYISLEWDFNIILPNQPHKVPQTHTLRIRIGNNLKPSEMIQVVFQGSEEYELEEVQSQMVCKIDFVNAQICSELKTVVSEWYEALPKNSEDHKLIKYILKHEVKIQNFVILSFLTSSVILLNYLFGFLTSTKFNFLPDDSTGKLYFVITASVPIVYFFYRMGVLFSDRILKKQIGKLRRNPMFEFTKGDKNKFKEIETSNKKLLKGLGLNIFYAISANFVAYLIGVILKIIINN